MVNTIPFVYRFHPMLREMRARVQSEEFGAVNLMHGSYLQDWLLEPTRRPAGGSIPKSGGPSRAFGDIGSHWCDVLEWVTDDRIAELVATTSITIKQRPALDSSDDERGPGATLRWPTWITEDSGVDLVPDRQLHRRLGSDQPAERRS